MGDLERDQGPFQREPLPVELLPRALRVLRQEGLRAVATHTFDTLKYMRKCLRCRRRLRRIPAQPSIPELLNFVFSQPIAPWQIRSEIQSLLELLVPHCPRTILEIGTARGGTLFLWTRAAHPQATIISLDLPSGFFGGGFPKWKIPLYRSFALPGQSIHLLRVDSHKPESLAGVKSLLGERRVDFMFIDADHTYDGVKKDFESYSPLLASEGLLALHDIATQEGHENYGVARFWRELKQVHNCIEFVDEASRGIAGIGVLLPRVQVSGAS